jgi:hypothetical protein
MAKIKNKIQLNRKRERMGGAVWYEKPILYSINKKILRKLYKHCVSVWIGSSTTAISVDNPEYGFLPIDTFIAEPRDIRSATLTFVKTSNRCYAITCFHVVESVEQFNKTFCSEQGISADTCKAYTLYTVTNKHIDLSDLEFRRPIPQYPDTQPDIVIAEIDEEIISGMGKIPINLDVNEVIPIDLKFAVAVGFPEKMKRRKEIDGQKRIAMGHYEIVAALVGEYDKTVTLHSALKTKVPRNYSGMSGGPIFWVNKYHYNLLGIVWESPRENYNVFPENEIMLRGTRACPATVKEWIKELFN